MNVTFSSGKVEELVDAFNIINQDCDKGMVVPFL